MRNVPLVVLSISATLAAFAGDSSRTVKIIANPTIRISEISREELNRIFLISKTSLSDGCHVQPVLVKGGQSQDAFLRAYIGRTNEALMTYYRSLVFTGKAAMPKVLNSDEDMARYVARTKGAVGYVALNVDTQGAKELRVK